MNFEQEYKADVIALSAAIQMLLKHLPEAREELAAKIPVLGEAAMFHALTDEQISRAVRALQILTRSG